MSILKKTHLFGGILIIVIFLLTGQYMHHKFNHLKDMELMSRALFRAGHLYILLFGLINLALGAYFKLSSRTLLKKLQVLGSVLIIVASTLIIYSFFSELPTDQIERQISRFSLYLILAGVSIHGFVSLLNKSD
ncbi:hypothetical protein [uncultured Winogradskyella sp.]|uniref:hypothetical protein n=1 Tax=uncultured Winogradskyella sp. TaxID=395353 RepID=UPI002603601D|nr:hypothetical protein [uncultured Winogradskyella sp.]